MIPEHQEYLACGRKRNFRAERTSQPLVGERALSDGDGWPLCIGFGRFDETGRTVVFLRK